jgi:hypothetical protein
MTRKDGSRFFALLAAPVHLENSLLKMMIPSYAPIGNVAVSPASTSLRTSPSFCPCLNATAIASCQSSKTFAVLLRNPSSRGDISCDRLFNGQPHSRSSGLNDGGQGIDGILRVLQRPRPLFALGAVALLSSSGLCSTGHVRFNGRLVNLF